MYLAPEVDGFWQRVGWRMLPPRCLLCGQRGEPGLDLCRGCRAALPGNAPACARCALPLPMPAAACGECLARPPPFAAALAPWRYAEPLNGLVLRFKFAAELACGPVLATLAAPTFAPAAAGVDALVAVPLHRRRLAERGYNQSLLLADALARRLGLPLLPAALDRVRATAAQSGLDAAARRANVRGAFVARAGAVAGRRIALIDDVVTTGATVRECARALRRAGAARVEVWCLARAEAPRGAV